MMDEKILTIVDGTGAGQVEVRITQNSPGKGDIKLSSGNGNIILVLPDDFSMTLDVELGNYVNVFPQRLR